VLEISAAADGTDLRLDYISSDPDADGCAASANLDAAHRPFGFCPAMSPILVAAARECGLPPQALPGPAGMYIRRVFARTFNRCVDWNRLRRGVLGPPAARPARGVPHAAHVRGRHGATRVVQLGPPATCASWR
jgi:hypothetical protein